MANVEPRDRPICFCDRHPGIGPHWHDLVAGCTREPVEEPARAQRNGAASSCCNGTGYADYAAVPCPNPECSAPAPRGDCSGCARLETAVLALAEIVRVHLADAEAQADYIAMGPEPSDRVADIIAALRGGA